MTGVCVELSQEKIDAKKVHQNILYVVLYFVHAFVKFLLRFLFHKVKIRTTNIMKILAAQFDFETKIKLTL